MNTNTGNNIKSTRGALAGAKNKLSAIEVQLMMNLYIKGSTEFECCESFAISKQMFKKIVSGDKAYHYLRMTEPFETFILKIKESKANKTYFKEVDTVKEVTEVKVRKKRGRKTSDRIQKLYDEYSELIVILKSEGQIEREISEELDIDPKMVNYLFGKWKYENTTEDDLNLLELISSFKHKNIAKTRIARNTAAKSKLMETTESEVGYSNESLMGSHTMSHDFEATVQNPIKGEMYLYNGNELVQPVVQSPEIILDITDSPDMIKWISAKGRTHYLKLQIHEELSIRYHLVWDDRKGMQGEWMVKNHAESTWSKITKEAANVILSATGKSWDNYIEIMGMVENGKYTKYINEGRGTPWTRRDEEQVDKAHDERLAGRGWGVLEGVFFKNINNWRFEIEHDGQLIEVRIYKNSVYSHSFKNDYENIVKYIQANASLKNDQLFIPSEEMIFKAFDDYRSVGRG